MKKQHYDILKMDENEDYGKENEKWLYNEWQNTITACHKGPHEKSKNRFNTVSTYVPIKSYQHRFRWNCMS